MIMPTTNTEPAHIIVDRADVEGVTLRRSDTQSTTFVQWDTLRLAAVQADRDLAIRYSTALDTARRLMRGRMDPGGLPLIGRWVHWTNEDGEPCGMIAQ